MKPAVKSIQGDRFSFYSNSRSTVRAVGAGRYALNNPIKPNGDYTKYFEIVQLIANNPGITKKQILKGVNHPQSERPSVLCSTFQALMAGGLIQQPTRGHYTVGPFYEQYIKDYFLTSPHYDTFLKVYC